MARTKTSARGARGAGQKGASAPEETLRIEYVPLGDLKRWPRNPKEHDLGTIGASLRRFGMVETPVLDERTGRLGPWDVTLSTSSLGGSRPRWDRRRERR